MSTTGAAASQPMTNGQGFFEDHFNYVSAVTRGDIAATEDGIAQWWTPEGRQYTNGLLVCAGHASVLAHYREFPVKYASSEFRPLRWFQREGKLAVIEFDLHLQVREPAGDPAVKVLTIMAAFTMDGGRIAEMRQVATPAGTPAIQADEAR